MATLDSSPSDIRVSLHNADLWQNFYPINEMYVKKVGRKLFPNLDVKIEGLDPKELYAVSLYLERVDNYKYKFFNVTSEWKKCSVGNEILPVDKKQHKDGGMVGAHWMNSPVSFSEIRITTDPDYRSKPFKDVSILVSPRHKYRPVVTIKSLSDGKEEEFRLTMAEFMVVISYQNQKTTAMKNALNRFSPKFTGELPRGKRRVITSDPIPTASGPVPPSTNTVAPQVGSPVSSPAKKRTPPSLMPIYHQNQMNIPPLTSPSTIPSAMTSSSGASSNLPVQMKTSPALSPSPVAPDSSQKQIKVEPVSPPSTPPPAMAPSSMGSNNFQNPMLFPPVMAYPLPYMAPLAYNFQFWNPHGMPNMPQFPMVPMPPPQQWNMMYGLGNMPQFGIPGFPQYNNFNGAGPSSQPGSNNGNFYNGY